MKIREVNQREPRYPLNMAVLEEPDNLEYWLEKMSGKDVLGVDTETTGLDWFKDRVGGLCLAANDTGVYVRGNALAGGVLWLRDQVKKRRDLVFHGAKYDMHQLYGTFGLRIPYPVHDTLIQSFLIDNRGAPSSNKWGGHDLKGLAADYVDPFAKSPQQDLYESVVAAGGKRGSKQWKGDLLMGDTGLVGTYGLMDPWYTVHLHKQFIERIRNWEQPEENIPSLMSLYETEQWVLLALVDMERTGIRVKPKFFHEWEIELAEKKKKLEEQIFDIAKQQINLNSTPQLRELLYKKLKIPIKRWTQPKKKSKAEPQPATDEIALLGMTHPIAAPLLQWRDVNKQHGTYAKGLLRAIRPNGRIHCNFKQTGADTGRLSCEDPNLQQVPRESGARRGFVTDKGLVLRFADYSQVEMRFAAHASNDPTLVRGFRRDKDFDTHMATAMRMWALHVEATKEQRKFAKIMNFAMLYGAGAAKVASQLVTKMTRKEAINTIRSFGVKVDPLTPAHMQLAELLMERYFKEFPSVKQARFKYSDETKRNGYMTNFFGRRRYLDESECYKGFNTKIQGSAADLAKQGLAKVYRELQYNGGHVACLLQIHDEIVYLTDGDPKIDRQVLELLDDRTSFRIPIVADVSGSTTTWQDKKDLKLAA